MINVDSIVDNPLLKDRHAEQRQMLLDRFPVLSDCPHQYFLSLRKYLLDSPQRFFSPEVFESFHGWLTQRDTTARDTLKKFFAENTHELNRAFLHIEEINEYEWHDHFKDLDDYELIRFIDQKMNPSYLRLTEGVLTPLLRVVAYFSRRDREKKTDGLDTWNIANEVLRTDVREAVAPYQHTVRNGIAHGGITYLQKEIRYRDGKGNEEKLSDTNAIRLLDDLLDTCNALSLALSLFFLTHQEHGYLLPQNLVLNELKAETYAPWWEIVGCTPSAFAGLNQLIVYARPHTSDYSKVQLSTFHSGVLAERFAPGYDRYFFSLRAKGALPGWAGFDGKKLRKLRREANATLEDYVGVLDDNLVFYSPRFRLPHFLYRIHNLVTSVRIQWPSAAANFRKQMGWHSATARAATVHRNAWGCVLNASVVFHPMDGDISQDAIRQSCGMIVRKCLRCARHRTSRIDIARHLPLGYTRIAVFQRDYRQRRLSSFGLGEDLICTIQVQYIRRIRPPDIMKSTIEQRGRYRIAWNRAWLESQGIGSK